MRIVVCAWMSALLACLGCEPSVSPDEPSEVAPEDDSDRAATGDEDDGSDPAQDAPDPMAQLAEMDPREPVPLQPMMAWHQKQNMQEHLVAIQRIVGGAAKEDWEEVGEAAELIESSPEMQQMCRHMGAGADGFTEQALEFHRRADAIGEAADDADRAAVLKATSETLRTCTSCHARFRQQVVDADTWKKRTGSTHEPSMPMHHGGGAPPHGGQAVHGR